MTAKICRILGNDLFPRHLPGQTERNLRFILRHEPQIKGHQRSWLLNRIVNRRREERLVRILEDAGESYRRIPFQVKEYRTKLAIERERSFSDLLSVRDQKLIAAVDLNGVRNSVIDTCEDEWCLPLDGNCFFTRRGWEGVQKAIEAPDTEIVLIPLYAVTRNGEILGNARVGSLRLEPQTAIRTSSGIRFQEGLPYGRMSKAELFVRLGIPGPWNSWEHKLLKRAEKEEGRIFVSAGYLYRLSSGNPIGDHYARHRRWLRSLASDLFLRRVESARAER